MIRRGFVGAMLLLGCVLVGCGGGGPGSGDNALSGKVMFKGQPVKFVTMVVSGADGKVSGGSTNENGEYLIPDPPSGNLSFKFISAPRQNGNAATGPTVLPAKFASLPNGVNFDYTGGKKTHDIELTP